MIISSSERTVQVKTERKFQALILYSVLSDWTPDDTIVSQEAVDRMRRGLGGLGIEATPVIIRLDIAGPLKKFDPNECVIFNWCEGLDRDPNVYDIFPQVFEELGFAYTGSDAWALRATQKKAFTKSLLLEHKIPTPVSKIYDRAILNGWRRFPALVK